MLSILFLFGFTTSAQAQCGPYQYYEGIPVSGALTGWVIGGGGFWTLPNASGTAPRSGKACLLQNVAPAAPNTTYIISPKINTPSIAPKIGLVEFNITLKLEGICNAA